MNSEATFRPTRALARFFPVAQAVHPRPFTRERDADLAAIRYVLIGGPRPNCRPTVDAGVVAAAAVDSPPALP